MTVGRAIIIDDDVQITEVFSDILSIHGLEVLGVGHNGKEGVTLFKKYSPDIVFMDVQMPIMNGLEALKEIKRENSKANVVMVTGYTSKETQKELQKFGATAIIFKPFEIKKIADIIDKIKPTFSLIT